MSQHIEGRLLHGGEVEATTIRLDAPLSFWGGFDPTTGLVIDEAHPQVGQSLAGKVVVMPGSRGSAGTPGALAESIRRATGPAGMVVTKADVNLAAGAMVAAALYGTACPIVLVDQATFTQIPDDTVVTLGLEGTLG